MCGYYCSKSAASIVAFEFGNWFYTYLNSDRYVFIFSVGPVCVKECGGNDCRERGFGVQGKWERRRRRRVAIAAAVAADGVASIRGINHLSLPAVPHAVGTARW